MTQISKKHKYKVLIVDDHQVMIEGLSLFIQNFDELEVCAAAQTIQEGLKAASIHQPDIAIVDLSLQNNSGLELIQDLQLQHPHVNCIVLSMYDELLYGERALRTGAKGYVMKKQSFETVVTAIFIVLKGELFFSDTVKKSILNSFSNHSNIPQNHVIQSLSNREMEVFKLIGKGYRPRHIAEELSMSSHTVDTHCQRIRLKLNIQNMKELILYASEYVNSSEC